MTVSRPELNASLEIALDIRADLGEGPIWDGESATLVFVDSTLGRVHRFDPLTNSLASHAAGQQVGAAIPRRFGGLVLAAEAGLLSFDEASGEVGLLVPIEADMPDNRMNDARCDSRGRLWTGSFSRKSERRAGSLYRVDPDLKVTRAVVDITVSNGIAWSPDETVMYYVDTATRRIDMFDYDIQTGDAANRRRFVDIDRSCGLPDGITVDAEGHVWVALYLGGAVRRYSPGGAWVATVTLPVARVTSCCFGGSLLEDLYITSANYLLSDDGFPHEPHAGAVFRCRPALRGLPACRFAG